MERSIIQYLTEDASKENKAKLNIAVFDWLKSIGKGGSIFTPTKPPEKPK